MISFATTTSNESLKLKDLEMTLHTRERRSVVNVEKIGQEQNSFTFLQPR
jgi:hypothetical protein